MLGFLRSLSIKAVVTTTLGCFALLLAVVAGLGYGGTRIGDQALEDRTRTATRIDLLRQADMLRLKAFARLEAYGKMSLVGQVSFAERQKQQAELHELITLAGKTLADFQAMPPFSREDGRKLLEKAAASLAESLGTLDRQLQAWSKLDTETYDQLEDDMMFKRGPQIAKDLADTMAYLEAHGARQMADYHSSLTTFALIGGISWPSPCC
ncbi:Tar ligand binding domain-containing protein [Azotobacter sp. CWF10]